jgi:hypothetical protein
MLRHISCGAQACELTASARSARRLTETDATLVETEQPEELAVVAEHDHSPMR